MAATPPDSPPAANDSNDSNGSNDASHAKDARRTALERWLAERFPGPAFTLAPASADASFRRYFRARFAAPPRTGLGATLIAMDAPPPQENCAPFVHVATLLADAGLHAPRVVEADLERGFLALTDLGDTTYLAALEADRGRAGALFSDATDALVRWQLASRADELPPYDAALLRRELDLFPDWYVARHLGVALSAAQRETLERVFAVLVASALAQPRVYVHRDFMPRNLMVCEPNPGILDFQDAVHGPIAYDVVSLFKDAFISWDEAEVLDWTIRYWEEARRARLPVAEDFGAFYRDFEWMGLQRHLKVAGIFARLAYRDGKPAYLADTPRFIAYVRSVCSRYDALAPLAALVDALEARPRETRYTF